ncbi:lycopene cyclase domain-containing protein [candidate division FCPU426 bacterium]|nr:lycopene cyclase domain-containing protein [candidate division FCPU426 bacterium]
MPEGTRGESGLANKRIPWYFISIFAFFVLPLAWLFKKVKTIEYPALIKSVLTIMVLGYCWSYLVTSHAWWVFNPDTMLGLELVPHLPLEEILFYPLGGILSILVYVALREAGLSGGKVDRSYFWILAGITLLVLAAAAYSFWKHGKVPWYILSQVVLYNGISLGLYFRPSGRIAAGPALLSVLIMTVVGFFWNWLAFTQGWWKYYAVLGWMWPPQVPVDDWNFYLFAPLAAMSLYENYTRAGK